MTQDLFFSWQFDIMMENLVCHHFHISLIRIANIFNSANSSFLRFIMNHASPPTPPCILSVLLKGCGYAICKIDGTPSIIGRGRRIYIYQSALLEPLYHSKLLSWAEGGSLNHSAATDAICELILECGSPQIWQRWAYT